MRPMGVNGPAIECVPGLTMNASAVSEQTALNLVDIVELKWLLAGEGLHVHVERLQSDPGYARQCVEAADRSPNAAVRQVADRLRRHLGLER